MSREEAIREITSRLVEFYHRDKIYLFGSEARGAAGPDSDLDFLVVVPDDTPREVINNRGKICRILSGIGVSKDIIPCTALDSSLAGILDEANALSDYAWRFRYPVPDIGRMHRKATQHSSWPDAL